MAKKSRKVDTDPRQMSLLDLLQQTCKPQEELDAQGSKNVHGRFCRSLTRAINASGLSRWEVAGRMSHLLDCEITKYQIDAWTAESKDSHRIPAEYLPAFCVATNSSEPLQILAEVSGMFCLPGADALRAELQRLDEEAKRIAAEKRKRMMFLRELEGQ